jgi:hypothetical protein
MHGDGDFIVAWISDQDGDPSGVFAQCFGTDGTRMGVEFQVNTHTPGRQHILSLAMNAVGQGVVVWVSSDQDGSDRGVFGKWLGPGCKLGPEFQVNSYTLREQVYPSVAIDPAGTAIVVWDNDRGRVFGRPFEYGEPMSDDIEITDSLHLHGRGRYAAAASNPPHGFVVAWQQQQNSGEYDVMGRLLGGDGQPRSDVFQVNSHTGGWQEFPRVGVGAQGLFTIVWSNFGEPPGPTSAWGQTFSHGGVKLGKETLMMAVPPGHTIPESLVMDSNGDAVLTASTYYADGDRFGVFARTNLPRTPASSYVVPTLARETMLILMLVLAATALRTLGRR